jgi:hypothetical protein
MGTVILDDELKAKLNGLNQPLEIRDTSGKLVGHFIPETEYRRMIYNEAKLAFAAEEADWPSRKWPPAELRPVGSLSA